MKNLSNIFDIIKKYSEESGISNTQCFNELEKLDANNSILFPLFSYLRVLQGLGLIKLYKFSKAFAITEKGKDINHISLSIATLSVLWLHILRRAVIVSALFLLFWPMVLGVQKQYDAEENPSHRHLHQ